MSCKALGKLLTFQLLLSVELAVVEDDGLAVINRLTEPL
jgi:hypothetical protein